MEEKTTLTPLLLKNLFTEINRSSGFNCTILTDDSGLPIASSSDDTEDTDVTAATVSRIQQTVLQTKDHLNMGQLEEVSLNDSSGKRLVIRPFNAGSTLFFLAVILPNKSITYKRTMKKVISEITRKWTI